MYLKRRASTQRFDWCLCLCVLEKSILRSSFDSFIFHARIVVLVHEQNHSPARARAVGHLSM